MELEDFDRVAAAGEIGEGNAPPEWQFIGLRQRDRTRSLHGQDRLVAAGGVPGQL
jgi:hypothetical protein